MTQSDRAALRTKLKQRRRALDSDSVEAASRLVAENFWRSARVRRAGSIAAYMATGGEIDCGEILREAELRKMRVFVPVLAGKRLKFAALKSGTRLEPNCYGILEPVYRQRDLIEPRQLDIVLVPLLAFDEQLNRMGMGAGYYDRTFGFSRQRGKWRHPLLVGLAHSFQRVDNLQAANWDVPLHAVVTEKKCYGSL